MNGLCVNLLKCLLFRSVIAIEWVVSRWMAAKWISLSFLTLRAAFVEGIRELLSDFNVEFFFIDTWNGEYFIHRPAFKGIKRLVGRWLIDRWLDALFSNSVIPFLHCNSHQLPIAKLEMFYLIKSDVDANKVFILPYSNEDFHFSDDSARDSFVFSFEHSFQLLWSLLCKNSKKTVCLIYKSFGQASKSTEKSIRTQKYGPNECWMGTAVSERRNIRVTNLWRL